MDDNNKPVINADTTAVAGTADFARGETQAVQHIDESAFAPVEAASEGEPLGVEVEPEGADEEVPEAEHEWPAESQITQDSTGTDAVDQAGAVAGTAEEPANDAAFEDAHAAAAQVTSIIEGAENPELTSAQLAVDHELNGLADALGAAATAPAEEILPEDPAEAIRYLNNKINAQRDRIATLEVQNAVQAKHLVEVSSLIGGLIKTQNELVKFCNGLPNNKPVLYVLMQNAIAFYNEVQADMDSRGCANMVVKFSPEVVDELTERLDIVPVAEGSDQPAAVISARNEAGEWAVEETPADEGKAFTAAVINDLILAEALQAGYKLGDSVYFNIYAGDKQAPAEPAPATDGSGQEASAASAEGQPQPIVVPDNAP